METIEEHVLSVKPNLTITSKKGETHRLISIEDEEYLDKMVLEIRNEMANSTITIDSPESEKDSAYEKVKSMWNQASGKNLGLLNRVKFNLPLYRDEYKYITDLFLKDMEYDVDTVFIALELLGALGSIAEMKFKDDKEIKFFQLTPLDMTYVYHILAKVKLKGLTKNTISYTNIVKGIATISKIFKYYENEYNILVTEIQNWASTFSDDVKNTVSEQ